MAQTNGDATSRAPGFPSYESIDEDGQAKPCVYGHAVGEPGHAGDAAQARHAAHRTEGRADRGRRPVKRDAALTVAAGQSATARAAADATRRRACAWPRGPAIAGPGARVLRPRRRRQRRRPSASLNVSDRVGDDPAAVATNWARVRARAARPGVRPHAAGARRRASCASRAADQPVGEADGMITARAGLGLAVLTADCVPHARASRPRAHAVMALHAGWRGTARRHRRGRRRRGARRELGVAPAEWQVALGPSIGGCCYEVETEIGQQFVDRWGAMPDAWQPAGAPRPARPARRQPRRS